MAVTNNLEQHPRLSKYYFVRNRLGVLVVRTGREELPWLWRIRIKGSTYLAVKQGSISFDLFLTDTKGSVGYYQPIDVIMQSLHREALHQKSLEDAIMRLKQHIETFEQDMRLELER
jgi:hypothetical protein